MARRPETLERREQQSHTQTHTLSPETAYIPSANSLPTANSMGGFKNSFPSSQTHMRGGKKFSCLFLLSRTH